jgi:mannose-6-phosphate isomerase-like protein (cupin superfamily)
MKPGKTIIIRSAEKEGTKTASSEYIFHFSSYPVQGNIGFYEGHFKNASQNKNLHFHKIMTEIFTVIQGEFYFDIGNEEYILTSNDTIIIPPGITHGFRAKLPDSRLQFIFTDVTNREGFFTGIAKIANGEMVLNEEELEAFYNSHDQYSVKCTSVKNINSKHIK